MTVALVTGSAGLVGSESVRHFASLGFTTVGIDNDMRMEFFGPQSTTKPILEQLRKDVPKYRHFDVDVRDTLSIDQIFRSYGNDISLVIHAAAQPSHDWAARQPLVDFTINANGTLNLLEAMRRYSPRAAFIFLSTNKVYGDRPNSLPLVELETRWEIDPHHPYANGISETMSIDGSTHSLFGASKAAADLVVQEYGRYFGLNTACFRCGCLTGSSHSGAMLHGFLSYLVKCTMTGTHYTVLGHKGKQVRDNLHSSDLVRAFEAFASEPRPSAVYNMGGSRESNCSIQEAFELTQEITGRRLSYSYCDTNRRGDHIWWISDVSQFRADYPKWHVSYDTGAIIREIASNGARRWI